jgi:predicted metalloprotease with PDZ domain
VFLRRNLVNAGGGVALSGSFIGSYNTKKDVSEFKLTLAHEMFHTWAQSLDAPKGLEASWFGEGLAVLYARRLAYRFGQISRDQFLQDLNRTAARYYTDALNDVPNAEIPKRFWADTRIRVLPYDRGSMYFARVDSELRAASAGKRSLDDLLLSLLRRRAQGLPLDQQVWDQTVTEALGPEAHAEFERMLAGALMLPPSDAFGPCFRRTSVRLRRYELGFEPAVLTESSRIVRGLVAGSAAEQAGLRNGDQITQPVPQDAIQADQHATLTLQVRRGGRSFAISYLPRGELTPAYQWVRAPAPPHARCSL